MRFVNRAEEIRQLTEIRELSKKGLYTLSVSGLRRVGKTRLLLEFAPESLYFFVNAKKTSQSLLEEYASVLRERGVLKELEILNTWDDFFKVIFERHKGIVIFDEFQNMEFVEKSVPGILQKFLDLNEGTEGLLIVFSGSLIGLLKKMFTYKKEPLYGRIKRKIRLEQMSFINSVKMCSEAGIKTIEDCISLYAVFGGFPLYYVKIQDEGLEGTFQEIMDRFFFIEGVLEDEVQSILSMEFGKRSGFYYWILEAIANGNTRLSEIAGYMRKEPTKITRQLNEMKQYFELVDVEENITGGKTLYKIKNPLVNFWFRFFNKQLSDYKKRDSCFIKSVKDNLNSYIGRGFELVCREMLLDKFNLPVSITKLGRQWGKIPNKPKGEGEYEIDIVCLDEPKKEALFVECKWADLKEKEARKILEELKEKSNFVEWERKKEYFGLVGKKVLGKENLRKEGFFVWDLGDFEKAIKEKK